MKAPPTMREYLDRCEQSRILTEAMTFVARVAYKQSKRIEDAEDIISAVAFKSNRFGKWFGSVSHAKAFLLVVVKRELIDYYRQPWTWREIMHDMGSDIADTSDDGALEALLDEWMIALDRLERLSEAEQELVRRKFVGDPVNDSTGKSRLYRARVKALRAA